MNAGSITSFTMSVGDSVTLVNSGSGWAIVNGSTMLQYATGAPLLGVNQTWQNVLGSRALGTTYTNTTGRPIMVSVTTSSSTNGAVTASATVAGVVIASQTVSESNGTVFTPFPNNMTFVVPPGATYSVSVGSGGSLTVWTELR